MQSWELPFADIFFRLSILDWLGVLDLLLVAVVCFTLLQIIRRSQAASLLRGGLVLITLLFLFTSFLDLPTFDRLVQAILLVLLIATPMVLQPEIRRALERIGRQTGLSRAVRQTTVERILPHLMRAIETFAANRTGVLIVLEGNQSLQPYLDTGVPIDSLVTSELLLTLFYGKSPLHDGAIIVRSDRILGAGCVLPLTGRELHFYRRMGTRHRAAVGMSEVSDALVVVVSEETGDISIALGGKLQTRLDTHVMRQLLYEFLTGTSQAAQPLSMQRLLRDSWEWLRSTLRWPDHRQLRNTVGLLLATAVITLATWAFLAEQVDPTIQENIENIPLMIEEIPPGMTLVAAPPATVTAVARTNTANAEKLQADNFQAVVSLRAYEIGQHQVPIFIQSDQREVNLLAANPSHLNIELARVISRTLPVLVEVNDPQDLSAAYRISGQPVSSPAAVVVIGPEPLLNRISTVQATLSIIGATTPITEILPIRALDEQNEEISGVELEPNQVEVTLEITRREDALDVGIRAVTEGNLPEGYWLSSLSATPASVTLRGEQALIAGINSFVDTLPVDLQQAVGPVTIQVPLNLPAGVTAVDNNGNPVHTVTVMAQISARTGDLLLRRPVELLGVREGVTATVDPAELELLISGPLPRLNDIEQNPDLVRVVLDISQEAPVPDQTVMLIPRIIVPDGVQAQLIGDSVLVTMTRD
jgi:diadenylate cyclase